MALEVAKKQPTEVLSHEAPFVGSERWLQESGQDEPASALNDGEDGEVPGCARAGAQ